MRINDSNGSVLNVRLIARSLLPKDLSNAVAGILGAAPVPAPFGEGQERLLFAVRTSFERLFHPNRHWNQFSHVGCFHAHPSCFHLASQGVLNPFAAIQGAYSQALERLQAAKGPLKADGLARPEHNSIQSNQGFAMSLTGDIQSLFSEADSLFRSNNPADRMLANHAKAKAFQLLQIISRLMHQAHWIRASCQ